MLIVSNPTSTSTPLRFINNTNSWGNKTNTSISFEGTLSKSPVGNMNNSLIQSRMFGTPIIGDISKAYLRIKVSQFDSVLRLFIWFDSELNMKVYRRCCMDFGDSQSALTLSIAQIKFVASLLCYLMSLIIVIFSCDSSSIGSNFGRSVGPERVSAMEKPQ